MVVRPSVLVIDRSAVGVIDVVSVARLFAVLPSCTPVGASIAALFVTAPAVAATVAVTVNVAVLPRPRSTVVSTSPLPDAVHAALAPARHVHEAAVNPAGKSSETGAALTADGPALEATMVYVTTSPGWALASPSVLVIDRSASGFNVSRSDAVSLPGNGSVTSLGGAMATWLASTPVADGDTGPVTVKVAVPFTDRSMLARRSPVPLAGQVPPVLVHVHVPDSNAAGNG